MTFETRTVQYRRSEFDERATALGRDGWELVNVFATGPSVDWLMAVFKRQVKEKPVAKKKGAPCTVSAPVVADSPSAPSNSSPS